MTIRKANDPAFGCADILIALNKIRIEVSSRQNRVCELEFYGSRVVRLPFTCCLVIINRGFDLLGSSADLTILAGRGLRFIRVITLLRRLGNE